MRICNLQQRMNMFELINEFSLLIERFTLNESLFQLAMKSDILLENYLPGKLSELNLGYEQLSEVAPGLIYCSITGELLTH